MRLQEIIQARKDESLEQLASLHESSIDEELSLVYGGLQSKPILLWRKRPPEDNGMG